MRRNPGKKSKEKPLFLQEAIRAQALLSQRTYLLFQVLSLPWHKA